MTQPLIYTALIIDDEKASQQALVDQLAEYAEIDLLGVENCVDEGISAILKQEPDILFLDVEMPVKNGFDLIRELQQYNVLPTIIFTTGYEKYAIEAIKNSAFDFLLKPINPLELKKAIVRFKKNGKISSTKNQTQKLLNSFENRNSLQIDLRTGFLIIEQNELVYCKAEGNYTTLYLNDGKEEVVCYNLKNIENQLPSDTFIRLNRSHVINTGFLKKIDLKNRYCEIKCNGEYHKIKLPVKILKKLVLPQI